MDTQYGHPVLRSPGGTLTYINKTRFLFLIIVFLLRDILMTLRIIPYYKAYI